MDPGFLFLMGNLLILSKEDAKNCYLENRTLMCLILLAVAEGIIRYLAGTWDSPIESLLYELMLFIMMKLSRDKMGEGDLVVLASLVMFFPVYELWTSLLSTFVLLVPAALCLWVLEKNTQSGLPFLPFLTGGILIARICKFWLF